MHTPFTSPRPTYPLTPTVLTMLAAATFDTSTTWLVISGNHGVETNPTLAPLIQHSLIWIPIYLLSRPLLVPFLPPLCRFTFALYFALAGLLFGANNLAGLLTGRYFLVDTLGFPASQAICVLLPATLFLRTLWTRTPSPPNRKHQLLTASLTLTLFLVIELAFFTTAHLLPQK